MKYKNKGIEAFSYCHKTGICTVSCDKISEQYKMSFDIYREIVDAIREVYNFQKDSISVISDNSD